MPAATAAAWAQPGREGGQECRRSATMEFRRSTPPAWGSNNPPCRSAVQAVTRSMSATDMLSRDSRQHCSYCLFLKASPLQQFNSAWCSRVLVWLFARAFSDTSVWAVWLLENCAARPAPSPPFELRYHDLTLIRPCCCLLGLPRPTTKPRPASCTIRTPAAPDP